MKKKTLWLRTGVVAACLAASGAVQAQSASIDFTTIGTSPTSGTLSNGVSWSVSGPGKWEHISDSGQIYDHYTFNINETQTWTFSEAVNLSLSVAGLNCPSEAIRLGGGTATVASLSTSHTWNAGTQTVSHGSSSPADGPLQSTFTMDNVTTVTLSGVNANCRRGLVALSVTPVASAQAVAVPTLGELGLLSLALAIVGGVAVRGGLRHKRLG